MEDPRQNFKLIKASRLIDGRGGPPIEQGAVLVQGSKIIAVGSARDVLPPEGAKMETYDYPDKTIMPGLIDCHTHHNGFGDGRPGEEVAALPPACCPSFTPLVMLTQCKASPDTLQVPGYWPESPTVGSRHERTARFRADPR